MELCEGTTVEFKKEYSKTVLKTVVAFANTHGGDIYIGVEDDGNVTGVADYDVANTQLANAIRDSILPDITMFVQLRSEVINGKTVLRCNIQEGIHKPYYIGSAGLTPGGVFVRIGASSSPASESAIRKMIIDCDGANFEEIRSMDQNLTFDILKLKFDAMNISLNDANMRTLLIKNSDGLFTNLGLLLSDQCPHIVKAAVFSDDGFTDFQDRKEFGGSLLKQLEDAYEFLSLVNKKHSTYEGLARIDRTDYPPIAIREILLNAIVHRDYSVFAPTLIKVNDRCIEITSVGGLTGNLKIEDAFMGVSVCRNRHLADIFYRLSLIESYGTGIEKTFNAYKKYGLTPQFFSTDNTFKVILPKIVNEKLSATDDFLSEHSFFKTTEFMEYMGISQATASRLLNGLIGSGRIKRHGNGKLTEYEVV